MKKYLAAFALLPLLLAGCNDDKPADTNSSQTGGGEAPDSSQTVTKKYTVTFANTSMAPVEIEEGKTLSRPSDPTKAGSIFVGWYHDAAFTKEVSFPLVIKADTTIYANFYSHKDAFEKARKNTIGDDVAGYQYDYTVHAQAQYMNLSLNGNTTGNAKYRADTTDVTFLDKHVNSGSLFYDGTKYQMKKGLELHKIALDQNNQVDSYKIEQVGEDYKYDTSSFAKAVFEYDDKQLKEIKPTAVADEYELKTSFNWSKALVLVGNYLNHPIVEKIIGSLPETAAQTHMYVTFSGDKLNSYRYEIEVNVTNIVFSLTYEMTFKNVGQAPTIVAPVFENTYVGAADVARVKGEVTSKFDAYKELTNSSYDYNVKTAVDFKGKNAIDATAKGFTKRKFDAEKVYYLNDYEIDTDLKNADLYKDAGLKDVHAARANLKNGEVHDLKKKLTSFGGAYEDIKTVSEDPNDRYYLFDVLDAAGTPTYIQKIGDQEAGTMTYIIGADTAGASRVLTYINDSLRINAIGESTAEVKAFGSFSNAEIETYEFEVVLAGNAFKEMTLHIDGAFQTSYPGSRDFTAVQDAGFKLDYSLTTTDKGAGYEPATAVSGIK